MFVILLHRREFGTSGSRHRPASRDIDRGKHRNGPPCSPPMDHMLWKHADKNCFVKVAYHHLGPELPLTQKPGTRSRVGRWR